MNLINKSTINGEFTVVISLPITFWRECGDALISDLKEYEKVYTKITKDRSDYYEAERQAHEEKLDAWKKKPFFKRWFTDEPQFKASSRILTAGELSDIIWNKSYVCEAILDIESIQGGGLDKLISHSTIVCGTITEAYQQWESDNACKN